MRADFEQLIQGAGLLLGGGVGGKLLEWVLARREKRQKAPADLMRAMGEFSDSLSSGGAELINEFRKEFERLHAQIADLTRRADAAENAATAALSAHSECERKVSRLQAEIAALVAASRVAAIGEPVPEHLK